MEINGFSEHFGQLSDPRQSSKVCYPLFDVLFLTLCAVIAGCEGWEDIEDFGDAHIAWFQSKGLFPNDIPVHDTIARIIARLDPSEFNRSFTNWMQAVHDSTDGELIAIDGKTLRRSYDRNSRTSAIHMISAFATANGVVLGQLKTEAKSNEITAIPELLQLLDINGCLVSIDAMGCQTAIASTIVARGGDYLLAVKGNQETLANAVKQRLQSVDRTACGTLTKAQGHGRVELREYHVLPAAELAEQFPQWPKLATIGVAIGYRRECKSSKESLEYRYYISSAALSEARFAAAVRGHWQVENQLHWVLDATMGEDASPIHRNHGAEIMAGIRRMALNMLRAEPTPKISIRRKQQRAHMKPDYLEQVLLAGIRGLNKK